jgi:hypothetical protein
MLWLKPTTIFFASPRVIARRMYRVFPRGS